MLPVTARIMVFPFNMVAPFLLWWVTDGDAENGGRRLFHIRVRTVLVHAVCSVRTSHLMSCGNFFACAMSAQLIRHVREQADT